MKHFVTSDNSSTISFARKKYYQLVWDTLVIMKSIIEVIP